MDLEQSEKAEIRVLKYSFIKRRSKSPDCNFVCLLKTLNEKSKIILNYIP